MKGRMLKYVLLLFVFFSAVIFILNPIIRGAKHVPLTRRCMFQIRSVGKSLLVYKDDYDTWPANNWGTAIIDYVGGSTSLETCPALGEGMEGGYTLNSALFSAKTSAHTTMLFDGAPGLSRIGTIESAVARHDGGTIVLTTDLAAKLWQRR